MLAAMPPRTVRRSPGALLAVPLALLMSACATTGNEAKLLDQTLEAHGSMVRWGDPLAGLEFVDPALRDRLEPKGLERERWRQFQVAGYRAQPPVMLAPDRAQRTVELELVNRNTQVARALAWRQEWRYDPAAKRWWLVSGLPALDAGAR
jgi:hypothetical protein